MNLLTNAIEAIQVGVEDYKHGSRPRLLAAVRNIYAGLLLLYKEALRRKSPPGSQEVLIKGRVELQRDSSGRVVPVGIGNKTVDVRRIREHFLSLGITTDWERFKKIQKIRNDVEHYYSTIHPNALGSVIASAFVILRDFIDRELRDDPRSLLGEKTWDQMLQVTDVYQAERTACEEAIHSIEWISPTLLEAALSLQCSDCGSDLLVAAPMNSPQEAASLQCRACGKKETAEELIPRAIAEWLSYERYLAFTDGNDLPYVSCPECSEDAYLISERRCANCGCEATHTCERCGSEIPPEELESSPYCGWCAHMLRKDD